MNSISPEAKRVPLMVKKFSASGLLPELFQDAFLHSRPRERNFVEDMRRLLGQQEISLTGIENIPSQGGGLIVFNHPEVHIIVPAIFCLPVYLKDIYNRTDFRILMGAELPFLGKFHHLPGSPALIRHLTNLYPDTFILVPSNRRRPDYKTGRSIAKAETLLHLRRGGLTALSPEAQISKDGSILPPKVFRKGAGTLGLEATRLGVPLIPMGVWLDQEGVIRVNIGQGFNLSGVTEPIQAVNAIMEKVALQVPNDLRGDFAS